METESDRPTVPMTAAGQEDATADITEMTPEAQPAAETELPHEAGYGFGV